VSGAPTPQRTGNVAPTEDAPFEGGGDVNNPYKAIEQLRRGTKLGQSLHVNGISAADATRMTQDHWDAVAGGLRMSSPSPQTIGNAIDTMKQLEYLKAISNLGVQ
jgi:hypothetical protein